MAQQQTEAQARALRRKARMKRRREKAAAEKKTRIHLIAGEEGFYVEPKLPKSLKRTKSGKAVEPTGDFWDGN